MTKPEYSPNVPIFSGLVLSLGTLDYPLNLISGPNGKSFRYKTCASYQLPKRGKRMTIFVEHLDIISHNDTNPNPNHEKIIPKILKLTITLLSGSKAQERYIS